MFKVNKDILEKKLENFNSLSIKDKYEQSQKLFFALNTSSNLEVENILSTSGFGSIFKKASILFQDELKKGLVVFPQLKSLQIGLVYPDQSKDSVVEFFDVSSFVDSISSSNLQKAVIMGFLMDESRMIIIQIYNHFTQDISAIIKESKKC